MPAVSLKITPSSPARTVMSLFSPGSPWAVATPASDVNATDACAAPGASASAPSASRAAGQRRIGRT
jgi:hypothetical protein